MKRFCLTLLLGLAASLAILPLDGCKKDASKTVAHKTDDAFAIYLVDGYPLGQEQSAETVAIDGLKLQDKPWLSLDDILYFDYSSHYIFLNKTFDTMAKISISTPFVIVANGQRCCLGYVLSLISSNLPHGKPYFYYPSDYNGRTYLSSTDDRIRLQMDRMGGASLDPRIYEALSKAGKLNQGLGIELRTVRLVSRSNPATISYSFVVTNKSDKPLYVPDPDKMGSDIFHYFTNGLVLKSDLDPAASFSAMNRPKPARSDVPKWDINWFVRLESHQSISRTVKLSGYPTLAKGTYGCWFMYSGPSLISREERVRPDGMIWIGSVGSNFIDITIR